MISRLLSMGSMRNHLKNMKLIASSCSKKNACVDKCYFAQTPTESKLDDKIGSFCAKKRVEILDASYCALERLERTPDTADVVRDACYIGTGAAIGVYL